MNAILAIEYQLSESVDAAPSKAKAKADRITRDQWEQDRRAELELVALQRRIRESSYLPDPADRFYVH
jgi:hypothetical protein